MRLVRKESASLSHEKWEKLRAFLIEEAVSGDLTALKLLGEMPKNTGEVKA